MWQVLIYKVTYEKSTFCRIAQNIALWDESTQQGSILKNKTKVLCPRFYQNKCVMKTIIKYFPVQNSSCIKIMSDKITANK